MDMTLEIVNGIITTSLYAKPNALHLFIPPHSCHAPGVITGHIFGQILRIYLLCTLEKVQEDELRLFFGRLLDRGYDSNFITPLFEKAIANATLYITRGAAYRRQLKAKEQDASRSCVFYHTLYHPAHPSSSQIQQLWREKVFCPRGKQQLKHISSRNGHKIPINRLIVANHRDRAHNLGNLLSYRKICNRMGPKVSSYLR